MCWADEFYLARRKLQWSSEIPVHFLRFLEETAALISNSFKFERPTRKQHSFEATGMTSNYKCYFLSYGHICFQNWLHLLRMQGIRRIKSWNVAVGSTYQWLEISQKIDGPDIYSEERSLNLLLYPAVWPLVNTLAGSGLRSDGL